MEKFSVLGVPISLQIWDTAGQERFKCIAGKSSSSTDRLESHRSFVLSAAYYRGAHVIVGVFDMTELTTLNSAERWINEALQTTAVDHPLIFLVGTKRDLIVNSFSFCSSSDTNVFQSDDKTFVRIETLAQTLAKQWNAEYWPVSSLTGQ